MEKWLITAAQFEKTPSVQEGETVLREKQYRWKSICFLEHLCKHQRLNCNKLTIATACVFLHRFYLVHSFQKHDRFLMAVACIVLACKTEEDNKRIKDIVYCYYDIRKKEKGCKIVFPKSEDECSMMVEKVMQAEVLLLRTLAFDIEVVHPFVSFLDKFKNELKMFIPDDKGKEFQTFASRYILDCYRSTIPIQYSPKDIAMAALFLSASVNYGEKPLKRDGYEREWIELFSKDITAERLLEMCTIMNEMYDYDGTNQDRLRKGLEALEVALCYVKPSPNCISTSPSVPLVSTSSPWASSGVDGQDDDEGIDFEMEPEAPKRTVTVSKVQPVRNGTETSLVVSALMPAGDSTSRSFPPESPLMPPPPPSCPDSPWSDSAPPPPPPSCPGSPWVPPPPSPMCSSACTPAHLAHTPSTPSHPPPPPPEFDDDPDEISLMKRPRVM